MFTFQYFIFITSAVFRVLTVPPSACRADFRWEDCGKPPKPVMYYWKQGSRCEVGIWKGCLPNPNMFADEYECINTCVFQEKPIQRTEEPETETEVSSTESGNTTEIANTTDTSEATSGGNDTSVVTESSDTPSGNSTGADDSASTSGGDTDATDTTEGTETTAAE